MEVEFELFKKQMDLLEERIDQPCGLVSEKLKKRNYHTALSSGLVHRTLENLTYALGLMTLKRVPEADRIINLVLDQQDVDPRHDTFGVWPYLFEEPLEEMLNPDWNWAVFIGRLLLVLRFDYRGVLPQETERRIETAIANAAECTVRRNISPDYTNICIMSIFVTLGAGVLLGNERFTAFGTDKFRKLNALIKENGSITEFNSPDYGLIDIEETGHILRYLDDPEIVESAERLNDHLWSLMATHFHPATGQICPPHCRCYDDIKEGNLQTFLQLGLGDEIDLLGRVPVSYKIQWYYTTIRCPEKYRRLFLPTEKNTFFVQDVYRGKDRIEEDEIRVHIEKGQGPIEATSFCTPSYCIGSFNRHDLWNQRRPLMAYFDNNGVISMRMRCLNGDMDFSSAILTTLQEESKLVSAVHFVTDHGDYHFILDPLKDGTVACDRLSLQLEFGGAIDNVEIRQESDELFIAAIGPHRVFFRYIYGVFGANSPVPVLFDEGDRKGIRMVLHEKKGSRLDLKEIGKALVVFSIQIDDYQPNVCLMREKGADAQLVLGELESPMIPSTPGLYLNCGDKREKRVFKGGFLYK